ncbi:CGNR zinc finger domain-containing protein [Streptomyces sp. MNU76]|uniref:CGNR zinc finger domain-containing protein n=1 Tax=Streptomyces sp. MNU76 TaxID=2560026 RepID=UPI001E484548|nr:CGNR zinc finger domain-containing protein [Streptomyces sp. MNU76]MCC9703857.1 CGNR zinc finger domain-containing protein [Streptomyces sp. MNU76]
MTGTWHTPAPRFDCGHLCLDFLTTTHPEEQLDTPTGLRTWITAAHLVPETTPSTTSPPLAGRLQRTPRPHRPVGAPHPRPRPGPRAVDISLARVNDLARAATPALRAVRAPDGTLTRALDRVPECAALLAVLARDTVELLTDPVACASLRQCAGDNCPVVYVDTSRGRRRRWCSSEICGNRERVARHRRRADLARARA